MNRLLAIALAGLIGLAAGCTSSVPGAPAKTLTVLAGSEVKDIEPLLLDLQKATGYQLKMTYVGSLDGAQRIVTGDGAQLAWFSSAKYLSLLPGGASRIVAQNKIMLSPVVLGVKHSVAQRFGWVNNPNVTWADIAARSKSGDLHFGMTNPAASNSGFVALVGVAEAFAQSGSALDANTINDAALKDFFTGQSLTAGSSGFLATAYTRDQDSLDGMINYESVLLSLNQGSQLRDKLDLIYPKDGIATADYPLVLLDRSQRDAYDRITAWLKRPEVQTRIMQTTNRRPALPEVKPDSRFPNQVLVELPFPGSLDVVNKLIADYLDQARPPAHAIFVLDTSGSMQGVRLDELKKALLNLTGGDTTITGQFARFRQREDVTIILFNDRVYQKRDFTINDTSSSSKDLAAIRTYVNSFQAGGGTAIYDATYAGYQAAQAAMQSQPGHLYSIVLMTDGENNIGRSGSQFISDYRRLPSGVRGVRTFAVLFGDASPSELKQVADTTGGMVFDSRSTSLSQVFKDISGYQ